MALEHKDRSTPRAGAATSAGARAKGATSVKGDVGTALRSAYEQTVSETIPSEMLDLLGKLA